MKFPVEEANLIEKKQFLWYMVCKRYEFIRDLAIEVLHQRYQHLYNSLEKYDFIVFFNEKSRLA